MSKKETSPAGNQVKTSTTLGSDTKAEVKNPGGYEAEAKAHGTNQDSENAAVGTAVKEANAKQDADEGDPGNKNDPDKDADSE